MKSTISQHLGILRAQGIIHPQKNGVRTCYKVVDKRVQKLLILLQKEVAK